MGTSSWPALSLSSQESLSSDVDLPESPSKEMTIASETESDAGSSGSISTEIATATANVSSSISNLAVSISISVFVDGGSKRKKIVAPSNNNYRRASSTHPTRPFNQNHPQYQSQRFGKGDGFNARGRSKGGYGFQNQNNSKQPWGFNDWNSNSNQGFNNYRMINLGLLSLSSQQSFSSFVDLPESHSKEVTIASGSTSTEVATATANVSSSTPSTNHFRWPSSTHPTRPFSQNHPQYQSQRFGKGNGFNARGGKKVVAPSNNNFRWPSSHPTKPFNQNHPQYQSHNHNYSNQPWGFNDWNSLPVPPHLLPMASAQFYSTPTQAVE